MSCINSTYFYISANGHTTAQVRVCQDRYRYTYNQRAVYQKVTSFIKGVMCKDCKSRPTWGCSSSLPETSRYYPPPGQRPEPVTAGPPLSAGERAQWEAGLQDSEASSVGGGVGGLFTVTTEKYEF